MKKKGFFSTLAINSLSLAFAAMIVPGISVDGVVPLVVAAFLMALVNSVVKPVLVILTIPFTILTLGLFLLIINAALFGLVAFLLPGFSVAGFIPALLGWAIVSVTSWFASAVFN